LSERQNSFHPKAENIASTTIAVNCQSGTNFEAIAVKILNLQNDCCIGGSLTITKRRYKKKGGRDVNEATVFLFFFVCVFVCILYGFEIGDFRFPLTVS
jgi:hypothetical protein